jgi:hypothetical protein
MSESQNKSKPPFRDASRGGEQSNDSLAQFSQWIDAELLLLEARHQNFETKESARIYFQR